MIHLFELGFAVLEQFASSPGTLFWAESFELATPAGLAQALPWFIAMGGLKLGDSLTPANPALHVIIHHFSEESYGITAKLLEPVFDRSADLIRRSFLATADSSSFRYSHVS